MQLIVFLTFVFTVVRAFDYSQDKLLGVNVGGWLVLEPFITPSLFTGFDDTPPDEYHLCEKLGSAAQSVLEAHWGSWFTEKDVQDIANYGLNFMRIPIGYWAFDTMNDDPYVQGQEAYLDQAIEWARKYDVKVWVDLHGAAGSQNGFDNSGLRNSYRFQHEDCLPTTHSALAYLSQKYGAPDYSDVVIGVEIINEPLGPVLNMEKLQDFYLEGYNNIRKAGDNSVIFHDAFQQFHYWDGFFNVDQGYWNCVLDHHHYLVFASEELVTSVDEKVQTACNWGKNSSSEYHWAVNGEWSAAMTDCTPWLNGVGYGARYSGDYEGSYYIGSCEGKQDSSTWSPQDIEDSRRFVEAQMDAFSYSKNAGWVFWCFKTEASLEWDFKRLVNLGVIPQPLTDRRYPNQCGFY